MNFRPSLSFIELLLPEVISTRDQIKKRFWVLDSSANTKREFLNHFVNH